MSKKKPDLDTMIVNYKLRLSSGFRKKLKQEGGDVHAAEVATARLLCDLPDSQVEWRVGQLCKEFAQGRLDINATYEKENGEKQYVYHRLFVRRDNALLPLLQAVLPDVDDAIVRAPVPMLTGPPSPPLIHEIGGRNSLATLLRDGRLDPLREEFNGVDFLARLALSAKRASRAMDPPRNQPGLLPMQAILEAVETGLPLGELRQYELFSAFEERAHFLWAELQIGERAWDSITVEEAAHLGSVFGFEKVFSPAIWQGREASALALIDRLPAWIQGPIARETALLQGVGQEQVSRGWVKSVQASPVAMGRSA